MDIVKSTINMLNTYNELNLDADNIFNQLDKRIQDEYVLNKDLYEVTGNIQFINKNNKNLAISIYKTNRDTIMVDIIGPDIRWDFNNEADVIKYINDNMKSFYESQDELHNWMDNAQKIEDLYKQKYNEYVKNNKDNHLDYSDWLNNLPMSYKNDIEKSLK